MEKLTKKIGIILQKYKDGEISKETVQEVEDVTSILYCIPNKDIREIENIVTAIVDEAMNVRQMTEEMKNQIEELKREKYLDCGKQDVLNDEEVDRLLTRIDTTLDANGLFGRRVEVN